MHLHVTDSDQTRTVCYNIIDGKPFTFTSKSSRVLKQIELLLIFLKRSAQLWTLEEYWTQVGLFTGNSASTADFTWSAIHISLSYLLNVCTVKVG